MAQAATMSVPMEQLDDFWDDFLPFVEEKRVIPVIGADLLTVEHQGATVPLYELVARKLAERLKVPLDDAAGPATLNDVVCRFLQARGRREEIYPKLRAIMKELPIEPPAALKRLARIRAFDLFVSLTFDSLLAQALNAERFGGRDAVQQIGYAPNKVVDLPSEPGRFTSPVVYSLFGKLSVGPDYVITEEDTLEFLHALQTDGKRPHLLFDALQTSHLLFLGSSFPDWLARFFMRTAKGRQLSMQRGESELLVDSRLRADRPLVAFLENFSYGTRILSVDPAQFIAELETRWLQKHPATAVAAQAAAPADDTGTPDLPSGGIFISYAKEDVEAARKIHDSLCELGLEVWFDKDRLEAGDQYDQKIRRNVKACSLFLPVISHNTNRRLEGYFRREWKLAEERSFGIAEGVPFILPAVVDDTPAYESLVPEVFKSTQWTTMPGGAMPADFQMRIVKLVRDYRKREKGLA
jgi:hypothetical protein